MVRHFQAILLERTLGFPQSNLILVAEDLSTSGQISSLWELFFIRHFSVTIRFTKPLTTLTLPRSEFVMKSQWRQQLREVSTAPPLFLHWSPGC